LVKSQVSSCAGWSCHPEGCTALVYEPCQQALLSGGRHGEICVFDVRQRRLRSTIKAFDHATIKAFSMLPEGQRAFIVGSSDGDIKVFCFACFPWDLAYSFQMFENISFLNTMRDLRLRRDRFFWLSGLGLFFFFCSWIDCWVY